MLSFIFLADGPCDEASWRVNDDKNQWWSRRDALVRIVSTSLWLGAGQHNQVVRDSAFIFRETNDRSKQSGVGITQEDATVEYSNSVVVHQGQILPTALAVPTERGMIRLWKEGFARAAKAPLGITISSVTDSKSALCSNAAWKELLLGGAVDNGKQAGQQRRSALNMDVTKLDKRELLKLLQHNCDVEFLRKHSLNGPEALILKKKNRDAVLRAYEDWNSSDVTVPPPGEEQRQADSNSSSSAIGLSYSRLVDTCKVLLGGMLARAKANSNSTVSAAGRPSGYLLLLHEDYPQELGVFGNERVIGKDEGRLPIVCAMGAVRDALDEEMAALMEAARSLNMHCVGANLGRTAEFTSKIVTALVAHAIADQLHAAVAALPVLNDSQGHGAEKSGGAGAETRIQKLEPQRKGAWRWDGTSNKTSSSKKRVREDSTSEGMTVKEDSSMQTTQHHMHIAAWLPIAIKDVTDDIDSRERLHGLIQLVVTSLWRSRLASEASHDSHPTAASEKDRHDENDVADPSAKVVPVLHLVFCDGSVARLTQRKLAIAMANQHMAAPSEYQVLQMLIALLQQPGVVTRAGGGTTTADILRQVLPSGLDKAARKALRVVSLTDTLPVCFAAGAAIAATNATVDSDCTRDQESLAQHAYAGKCSCCRNMEEERAERYDVVLLINAPRDAHSATAVRRCLYEYVYPDKEVPDEERKLLKKVGHMVLDGSLHSSGRRIAPPLAVTTLQHFAYHDRLYAAIEGAAANAKA